MITKPTMNIVDPVTNKTVTLLCPAVTDELINTGVAIPDIVHVTYNTGVKKVYKLDPKTNERVLDENNKPIILDSYPIMTTVVDFADGTKEIVQNSKDDGLQLDANGRPTIFAKETGLAFAVLKRITVGHYVETSDGLAYKSVGFGRILNNIIKSSVDQNELRKMRKAKANKQPKTDVSEKSKMPKPSLRQCVKELQEVIKTLNDDLKTMHASK